MIPKRLFYIAAIPMAVSSYLAAPAAFAAAEIVSTVRPTDIDTNSSTQENASRLAEQQRRIIALEQRVADLERHVRRPELADVRGRGSLAAPATAPVAEAAAAVVSSVQPGTAQAQAITNVQGTPLFDRKFSLEQGLTYTHYDKRSLVLSGFLALDSILLGKINLQQIKTDNVQYDLTARLNLSDRLSADLNTPIVYRRSNYFSPGVGGSAGGISDGSNHSRAIGDVNGGLYYQIQKSNARTSDWIASIRVRAPTGKHPFGVKLIKNTDPDNNNLLIPASQPTGNGVWATSIGLAVVKSYDPVVLFSNIGYNYNFRRHFRDLSSTETTTSPGDVRLGNSWTLGAGFALALNDRTSVNFAYSQSIQVASRLRGDAGPWIRQVGSESNSATFNTGLTHQLNKNLTMACSVAIGLTPDSPNVSVGVRFPYTF